MVTPDPHKVAMLGSDQDRNAYIDARRAAASSAPSDRERHELARRPPVPPSLELDPEDGFLILPPGQVDGVGEVVSAAQAVISRQGPGGVEFPHKPHLRTGLLEHDDLSLEGPFMRLALRPDIVSTVARYLGTWPVLGTVDVWYSRHVQGEPISSQLYHCDSTDVRQVKLFLHCTDVTAETGPLTIIDAAASARIRDALDYHFGGGARVDDEAVREHTGDSVAVPMCGSAGTLALIDTSRCMHFGSRLEPEAPPRVIAVVQYLTPYAFAFREDYRKEATHRSRPSPTTPRPEQLLLGAA